MKDNKRYAMLRLGLGCNVACPFCNVPWESYRYPMRLSLREIKEEIDRLARSGADRLEISGGEPTLRPELTEVIRYARGAGFAKIELQTNAVWLGRRDFAGELKGAGLTHAFVGLHSHLPKVHDLLVGHPGAFEPCVAGTRNLVRAGIEVVLNPVLTIVNYKFLPAFMEYVARDLPGVSLISLSAAQPHGRAWDNRGLVPRYGELSPFVEKALAAADRLGLLISNPFCGLPLCVGGWHKRLERNVEYCEARLGHPPGDGQKFHPPQCSSCALKPYCGGVWKEYPLIHPVSDLRPIVVGRLAPGEKRR